MKFGRMAVSAIILTLSLLALPAAASVQMQFNATSDNNYGGEPSYPYDISVNGGPNQWMMCIGFNEHISGGETWQADMASIGSLDPNSHLVYYQAAFLFEQAVADKGVNSDYNAAIWWLFEGAPGLTPGAQALVATAQSQSYTQGEFADVLLYTAIPGTQSGDLGTAQDFLSSTPEPGTLAMFGSGILGVAGFMRRKLLV